MTTYHILHTTHYIPVRRLGGDVGAGVEQRARGGVVPVVRGGVQRRVPVACARGAAAPRAQQRTEHARAALRRRQVHGGQPWGTRELYM